MNDEQSKEIREWLMNRSAYIGVYKTDQSLETSERCGRGTGVFIEFRGRKFVCTNAHVIHPAIQNPKETVIQVSTYSGGRGIASHELVALANSERLVVGEVVSPFGHRDLALIEIKPGHLEEVTEYKSFITSDDIDQTCVAEGDVLFFRGFPKNLVEYEDDAHAVDAEGGTVFAQVKKVYNELIILDKGNSNTSLKGVSGSGVFDKNRKLRGIEWGSVNDKQVIYVCPIARLFELFFPKNAVYAVFKRPDEDVIKNNQEH